MKKLIVQRGYFNLRTFPSVLFIAILLLLQVSQAMADANGRVGRAGAPPRNLDCTDCHTAGAAAPVVSLSGPGSVAAGSSNTFIFEITGGAGATAPAGVGGLDIVASGGTLAVPAGSTGIQLRGGEITHTAPTPFTPTGVIYEFNWTAPASAGVYTLYGAGLSGDGDGKEIGDGTATATLAITVGGGAGGTAPVTPGAPVAVIKAPNGAVENVPVQLTASASTPGSAPIVNYNWDFGDGTTGVGVTVRKIFPAGNFTVSLTVADTAGLTATATKPLAVAAPGATVASADAGGPYAADIGVPIALDASLSAGVIVSYDWDMGDGVIVNSTTPIAEYIYDVAGVYTITLTVTDDTAATATATTEAIITDPAAAPPPPDPNAPPPVPSDGEVLFNDNCMECHGMGGAGTAEAPTPITGVTAEAIMDAIATIPAMVAVASLADLTEDDIELIADYLDMDAAAVASITLASRNANQSYSIKRSYSAKNTQAFAKKKHPVVVQQSGAVGGLFLSMLAGLVLSWRFRVKR